MTKPIIQLTCVNNEGVFTKMTLDFDVVMGCSPHQLKLRQEKGPPVMHSGTIIMLKNGKEMAVMEAYDSVCDQWIKLTHPCVNVPEGSDAPHHVCDHGFAARTCGLCNHGSTFGSGR